MKRKLLIAAAGLAALAACSDSGQSAAEDDAQPTQTAAVTIEDGEDGAMAGAGDAPTDNAPTDGADSGAMAGDDDPEDVLTGGAQVVADAETQGGDGSPLVLATLEAGDTDGLEGELACSFTPDGAPGPILVGRAYVGDEERSQAVVKIGDYVEMLVSQSTGGFDAMVDGTSYGGRGMTVTLTPTSGDQADHEGTIYTATLLAQRGDGAERSWDGLWSCGP